MCSVYEGNNCVGDSFSMVRITVMEKTVGKIKGIFLETGKGFLCAQCESDYCQVALISTLEGVTGLCT